MAEASLVYLLACGPYYKIGRTTQRSFQGRVRGIQSSCPYPILAVGTIEGGAELEKALLERFSHLRVHGEWFFADPAILREFPENRFCLKANRSATQMRVRGTLSALAARSATG